MPNPPYIKGIGQLVLDRYTAQDHFEGKQFRHKASQVDLDAAPLNIDGYIANTVEEAIVDMTGILNTIGTSVYNTIQFNGNPLNKRFILNFTGLNFNVTDDPISLRTNVSIIGGSGVYQYTTANNATVTQLTSKSTAVTCNGRTGQITTSNASLAKGAAVSFTVNNNQIVSNKDVIIVNIASGGTLNSYDVCIDSVSVGAFSVVITNNGSGALAEALVINFAILRVN